MAGLKSCAHEGVSSVLSAECSSGSPLLTEAKSPRPTANTQHQNPRNKSMLSTTQAHSALSRSDLVLDEVVTDLPLARNPQVIA